MKRKDFDLRVTCVIELVLLIVIGYVAFVTMNSNIELGAKYDNLQKNSVSIEAYQDLVNSYDALEGAYEKLRLKYDEIVIDKVIIEPNE